MPWVVTCLRHKVRSESVRDLMKSNKVEHQCATADSALQVVRDLVTVAESDMDSNKIFGYSVSVARSKG